MNSHLDDTSSASCIQHSLTRGPPEEDGLVMDETHSGPFDGDVSSLLPSRMTCGSDTFITHPLRQREQSIQQRQLEQQRERQQPEEHCSFGREVEIVTAAAAAATEYVADASSASTNTTTSASSGIYSPQSLHAESSFIHEQSMSQLDLPGEEQEGRGVTTTTMPMMMMVEQDGCSEPGEELSQLLPAAGSLDLGGGFEEQSIRFDLKQLAQAVRENRHHHKGTPMKAMDRLRQPKVAATNEPPTSTANTPGRTRSKLDQVLHDAQQDTPWKHLSPDQIYTDLARLLSDADMHLSLHQSSEKDEDIFPIKAKAQSESMLIQQLSHDRDTQQRELQEASQQLQRSKHHVSSLQQELQSLEAEERTLDEELAREQSILRTLRKDLAIPESGLGVSLVPLSSRRLHWLLIFSVFLLLDVVIASILYAKYQRHLVQLEHSIWTGLPNEETVWSWLVPRQVHRRMLTRADIPM